MQALILGEDKIVFNNTQRQMIEAVFNDDLSVKNNFYKEFAMYGGFRCGKSFLFQLIAWILGAYYRNLNILYVRDTYKQLQDSVIKQFLKDFGKYNQFVYKKTDRIAEFETGSVINFRAFDQDTNILSNEYDAVFICQGEDIPEELFLQILGRLSGGKSLGKALLFNEGNPASTYVKKRYKDTTREQRENLGIYFLEAETFDNKDNLPDGYIDNLLKNYPESWINRYVYGGWEQIDEMVFSEFRESRHVVDIVDPAGITDYHKRAIGGDYGYRNPSAFLWGYKDFDGTIIIYDEFYKTGQLPDELAKANLRHGRQMTFMDFSIKKPDRDGKSLWGDLQQLGVWLIESNKDEINNILLVNSLLKTGKLKITKNCENLLREIKGYKWKRLKLGEEKNLDETPVDKDNHGIDAMLYLVNGLSQMTSVSKEEYDERKTIRYIVENGVYDMPATADLG